tara:strand:- start:411 stop:695 length:285 start_codon:yes stop_codon:yes gene_type:complete
VINSSLFIALSINCFSIFLILLRIEHLVPNLLFNFLLGLLFSYNLFTLFKCRKYAKIKANEPKEDCGQEKFDDVMLDIEDELVRRKNKERLEKN